MMGLKWNGQGAFHEWEIRRRRLARAVLFGMKQAKIFRWSEVHVEQFWSYLGHRVRDGWSASPSAAGLFSHHRTLEWWTEQQLRGSQTGRRHGRRHFPQLMNHERAINSVCSVELAEGEDWRVATLDRGKWKRLGSIFKEKFSVPWASGRQLSLTM